VLMTSVAIVDRVTVGQLELATPCTGWTLRRLLAHMIGQNYGFAAAAEGVSQNREVFADRTVGDTPAAEYGASATRVLAAFAAPGLLDGSMYLPEVRGGATLPATTAIGFHLIDYVAHGWDVAKSIGASVGYDREVLLAALRIAEAVPDEAKTTDASTPFGPSVATSSESTLDRIVAILGRAPDWTPPARPGSTTLG